VTFTFTTTTTSTTTIDIRQWLLDQRIELAVLQMYATTTSYSHYSEDHKNCGIQLLVAVIFAN